MANRTRPNQILFFVSDDEKRIIKAKMAQLGTKNMGAYLRKMAIDGYIIKVDTSVCLHVCHLSGPAVADRLNRSTLRRARLSARTSRPLTTVYANFQLPMCTAHIVTKWLVVSYTRLLTLTGRSRRLFSSALIKPRGLLLVRKRDALCCPDFPQISPGYQRQTARLLFVCSAKLINSACFYLSG